MAKTDMKLQVTTPQGTVSTKTFTAINPDAGNTELKNFGQMLNALTDNTYGKTDRVTTVNCDTEGGSAKQTATITLTNQSVSLADLKAALQSANRVYDITGISYNGDGTLYAFSSNSGCGASGILNSSIIRLYGGSNDLHNQITAPFTVTIRADETDNFKAAEAVFTITA